MLTDKERLLIYFSLFPCLDLELGRLYLRGQAGIQSCQHFISPVRILTDLQVLVCPLSSALTVVEWRENGAPPHSHTHLHIHFRIAMLDMKLWDMRNRVHFPCLPPPETSFTPIKKKGREYVMGEGGCESRG